MNLRLSKVLISILVIAQSIANAQDFDAIQKELEFLEIENIKLRSKVMPTIRKYGFESPQMDSLDQAILAFDSSALAKVVKIIDDHGWLSKRQIGKAANSTLFVVIQHAQDPSIRKKYFPLLEESAKRGHSSLADMATMQDRILVEEGEPQLYGTQSRMVDGELELYPIANPAELNKRRKKVGLPKMKAQ